MKVIIGSGQMCNLLWSYSSLIAHSLEHKEYTIILDFENYVHLYPNLKRNEYIYFVRSKKIKKIVLFLMKGFRFFSLLSIYDSSKRTKGLKFIDGWGYRQDYMLLSKYSDEIKKIFSPSAKVRNRCKFLFEEKKKNNSLIIGIHIRKGDYAGFMGGRYFYNNEDIIKFMEQMRNLFHKSRITFFLASNENIDLSYFEKYDCFINTHVSSIDDLYSLSLCDYIIGPPSTYSMWSSFWGEKPLLIIEDKNNELELNEFNIMIACDVFQSKKIWKHPC